MKNLSGFLEENPEVDEKVHVAQKMTQKSCPFIEVPYRYNSVRMYRAIILLRLGIQF